MQAFTEGDFGPCDILGFAFLAYKTKIPILRIHNIVQVVVVAKYRVDVGPSWRLSGNGELRPERMPRAASSAFSSRRPLWIRRVSNRLVKSG
jgi:hypothetical protein